MAKPKGAELTSGGDPASASLDAPTVGNCPDLGDGRLVQAFRIGRLLNALRWHQRQATFGSERHERAATRIFVILETSLVALFPEARGGGSPTCGRADARGLEWEGEDGVVRR